MAVLEGKVAIITGAAGGQGAAEALLFASAGASLVLTDIDPAGEDVAREVGSRARFMRHDVGDENGWATVVREALAAFGRIDILINNAGLFTRSAFEDTDTALIDRLIRVNQIGPFLGMLAVAQPMRDGGGGSIINISSVSGSRGFPQQAAYASTKWALRGLSKCAANDLGSAGVRVNTILPGLVDTPMLNENSPEEMQSFRAMIPLGRIAAPADIARTALFLASDEASYVTGAEIVVDGGISL